MKQKLVLSEKRFSRKEGHRPFLTQIDDRRIKLSQTFSRGSRGVTLCRTEGCPKRGAARKIKRIVETVLIGGEPSKQFWPDTTWKTRGWLLHGFIHENPRPGSSLWLSSKPCPLHQLSLSLSPVAPYITVLSSRPSIQPLNFAPYRVDRYLRLLAFSTGF